MKYGIFCRIVNTRTVFRSMSLSPSTGKHRQTSSTPAHTSDQCRCLHQLANRDGHRQHQHTLQINVAVSINWQTETDIVNTSTHFRSMSLSPSTGKHRHRQHQHTLQINVAVSINWQTETSSTPAHTSDQCRCLHQLANRDGHCQHQHTLQINVAVSINWQTQTDIVNTSTHFRSMSLSPLTGKHRQTLSTPAHTSDQCRCLHQLANTDRHCQHQHTLQINVAVSINWQTETDIVNTSTLQINVAVSINWQTETDIVNTSTHFRSMSLSPSTGKQRQTSSTPAHTSDHCRCLH